MNHIVVVVTRSISSLVFLLTLVTALHINVAAVAAATFTVTKTADTNDGTCDADCSLREAVAAANANSGADTIEFNIPTSDGSYNADNDYFLITLTSLLDLTDDSGAFINGYSQGGASRNTAAFGEPINTKLMIQIQTGTSYIRLNSDNNHLTGLNLLRTGSTTYPLQILSSANNWVEGNFLGSDIYGLAAVSGGALWIDGTSDNNIIGTNGDGVGDRGERNLFMHNINNVPTAFFGGRDGTILFRGTQVNNVVAGNYIGVDKTGRSCNGTGVGIGSFGGAKTTHQYMALT